MFNRSFLIVSSAFSHIYLSVIFYPLLLLSCFCCIFLFLFLFSKIAPRLQIKWRHISHHWNSLLMANVNLYIYLCLIRFFNYCYKYYLLKQSIFISLFLMILFFHDIANVLLIFSLNSPEKSLSSYFPLIIFIWYLSLS